MGIVAYGILEVQYPAERHWDKNNEVAWWEDFVEFQFNKDHAWQRAVSEFGTESYRLCHHGKLVQEHASPALDAVRRKDLGEVWMLDVSAILKAVASMQANEISSVVRMLAPCILELSGPEKYPCRLIVWTV